MIRPIPTIDAILQKSHSVSIEGVEAVAFKRTDFAAIVRLFLNSLPFDRELYLARYPQLAELEKNGQIASAYSHWLNHGYFEGRLVYGWEALPFDTPREILAGPGRYFDLLRAGLLAECYESHEEAEALYHAAIASHEFSLAAHVALAQLYLKVRQPLLCEEFARRALSLEPTCNAAASLAVDAAIALRSPEKAIAAAQQEGLELLTHEHALRLFDSGRISLSRRVIKRAKGDWINISFVSNSVAAKWIELNRLLRLLRVKGKRDLIGMGDRVAISHCLAQLGWRRMALRFLAPVLSPASLSDLVELREQEKILAAEAVRICQGAAVALSWVREAQTADDRSRSLLHLRLRLAHESDCVDEVLAIYSTDPELKENPDLAQIFAATLVRVKRFDEALSLCRQHWDGPQLRTWVLETALLAMRAEGRYNGLSFRAAPDVSRRSPIPRRIMQFWDSETPPRDVSEMMASWASRNPDFSHHVFSDTKARDFLRSHYGEEIVSLFDHCHHAAMRSDFFRLCYLLAFGGVYVDADEEALEPLCNLLDSHSTRNLFLCLAPDAFFVSNGFIACTAGDPLIRQAFEGAASILRAARTNASRPDIWYTAGPGQITQVVAKALLGSESNQFVRRTGFLYWHTRGRFTQMHELSYKMTISGNWRAKPWEYLHESAGN